MLVTHLRSHQQAGHPVSCCCRAVLQQRREGPGPPHCRAESQQSGQRFDMPQRHGRLERSCSTKPAVEPARLLAIGQLYAAGIQQHVQVECALAAIQLGGRTSSGEQRGRHRSAGVDQRRSVQHRQAVWRSLAQVAASLWRPSWLCCRRHALQEHLLATVQAGWLTRGAAHSACAGQRAIDGGLALRSLQVIMR